MACKGCSRCFNNIAGSGVLILTDSNVFPGEHDVVLIKDYTNMYNDAGGKSEGKTSAVTASDELYQETRGIIRIDPHILSKTKYIDIGKSSKHRYRCYIVYIPKLSCRQYYSIDTSHMSSSFRETTGMTRFPVRYIQNNITSGQLGDSLHDDKHRRREISGRVKDVLNVLFQ
jgi:hypothetical protein